MKPIPKLALALAAALLASCSGESPTPKAAALAAQSEGDSSASELAAQPPSDGDYREIEWDALIPPKWSPEALFGDANLDSIGDESPEAEALMGKLQTLWKEAPVVPELDGRKVRLPGFVVPLDMTAESIGEFLLVPYYGACIHVPPPPRNQIVYVVTAKGSEYRGTAGVMDAVTVIGTLRVEAQSTEMGDAGYRIDAVRVEPYARPDEEGAR